MTPSQHAQTQENRKKKFFFSIFCGQKLVGKIFLRPSPCTTVYRGGGGGGGVPTTPNPCWPAYPPVRLRPGGGRGYDSSHFLRTENSFGIIWSSPRQLRVKNTLRVGHRGPVGRKTTQKPPQNTKKWKKIVKKRLFSRFGHFGQNSDFSRKKSKTGIFFDITKPPLAQIYPKSGL